MPRQNSWKSKRGRAQRDRRGNDWREYAARRKELVGQVRLAAAWKGGKCGHRNATAALHGLRATVGCPDCDALMEFRLRFGRPATFEAFKFDTGRDGAAQRIGLATGGTASEFIRGASAGITAPDGGAPRTRRDGAMLSMFLDALFEDGQAARFPTGDFMGAWRGTGCGHAAASCRMYGDTVTVDCADCGNSIMFVHDGDGSFNVSIWCAPRRPGQYGVHGAAEVVDAVRGLVGTLAVPGRMADHMSADPERDAARAANLAECLVGHGLLRRAATDPDRPRGGLISSLSAAACDRTAFSKRAAKMVANMRRRGMRGTDGGAHSSEWQMMESLRLEWPHGFEGDGIDVARYDPAGISQYCVRCGFSTLDDAGAGADMWRRGCPECGYAGYLLGLAREDGLE